MFNLWGELVECKYRYFKVNRGEKFICLIDVKWDYV